MTLTTPAKDSLGTIDALLQRIAMRKVAEAETTHPSADAPDCTQEASEGCRTSENVADVKNDQPAGVDSAAVGGSQDSVQLNIGTKQTATGEDPAVETASVKATKDDGTTSHPADAENNALDGDKYSMVRKLAALIGPAQEAGNDLLAKIAVSSGSFNTKKPARQIYKRSEDADPTLPSDNVTDADQSASSPPPGKGVVDASNAAADGAAMAYAADDGDKEAETALVYDVVSRIAGTVKQAYADADTVAEYLTGFYAGEKRAEGEESLEDTAAMAGEEEAYSENDEDDMDDSGLEGLEGLEGIDEATLLQLLAQGQGMGGEDAAQSMGGEDPSMGGDPYMGGDSYMGGDPSMGGMDPAMAGGDPGMDPGMGGDEGDPSEEELAMLAEALAQAGVSPEEFQAQAAAKAASALRQKKAASKKGQYYTPKTASDKARLRAVVDFVNEVVHS